MYKVAIITASDKGFAGERHDESGAQVRDVLVAAGYTVMFYAVFPDDREELADIMQELCDNHEVDLVVTTGGTGFSQRDCMPEATLDIAQRQVPGIAEAIRSNGMHKTDRAMLSRGVAAIRERTLIVNLPGSPGAALENLECILPALGHGLDILTGRDGECGNKKEMPERRKRRCMVSSPSELVP